MNTNEQIDLICRQRLEPIQRRLEAAVAERREALMKLSQFEREAVREGAKDAAREPLVREAREAAKHDAELAREEAAERVKKERLRADRYQRRAYAAEAKLKALVESELDPYEFLAASEAVE